MSNLLVFWLACMENGGRNCLLPGSLLVHAMPAGDQAGWPANIDGNRDVSPCGSKAQSKNLTQGTLGETEQQD